MPNLLKGKLRQKVYVKAIAKWIFPSLRELLMYGELSKVRLGRQLCEGLEFAEGNLCGQGLHLIMKARGREGKLYRRQGAKKGILNAHCPSIESLARFRIHSPRAVLEVSSKLDEFLFPFPFHLTLHWGINYG